MRRCGWWDAEVGGVGGGGAEVIARQEAAKVLRVSAATYRVVKAVFAHLSQCRGSTSELHKTRGRLNQRANLGEGKRQLFA